MKRSLQFKRPLAVLRPTALALALAMGGSVVWAQSAPAGELSDAERAKRDANKVFSFIKFHAVKPAAPAAAPAPKAAAAPAPKPAPRPEAAVAAAPLPQASSPAAKPMAAAPAPATQEAAVDPRTLPPVSEPAPAPVAAAEPVSAPSPSSGPAAPAVEEEEDPGIKLVKYVAPELNQRAMQAMTGNTAKVRVRFTVMPDGSAAKVMAVSNAPRPVALVAIRAVEQWRFEGVKEPQEVEVEVDFKLND